ncbi:hypothetical protein DY000_02042926 [Brassica cretica]|uniref:Apple domain-containing protein n=1 Tax=Brassica cretica TaxID=69181 RepID=A0ABQ7BKE7_BRACR|nr:hypothetical protein DY000_02042926 [Brassica cretica]
MGSEVCCFSTVAGLGSFSAVCGVNFARFGFTIETANCLSLCSAKKHDRDCLWAGLRLNQRDIIEGRIPRVEIAGECGSGWTTRCTVSRTGLVQLAVWRADLR